MRTSQQEKQRGRLTGEITLFLSLMLLVLISFLCTALRSAQLAGSRYLFTLASEAAARSIFAAYDTQVWEQYRIMMLTDEELADQIGRECAEAYSRNGTLFPMTVTSVELAEIRTLTENGAAEWEKAAVAYMETRLPAELLSWLWEQSGLAEGLTDMTKGLTAFREMLEPVMKLEQQLCDLEEQLSKASEAFEQGRQLLEDVKACIDMIRRLTKEGAEEEDIRESWNALQESIGRIAEYAGNRREGIDVLRLQAEKELETTGQLKQQLQDILKNMGSEASSGLAALADLGSYMSGLAKRFDFLQNLPRQLERQREFLEQLTDISLPPLEEILEGNGEERLSALRETIAGLAGEQWATDRLEMTEGTEEDAQNVSRLLSLKSWLDQGILLLVLKDGTEVSQANLSRTVSRTQEEAGAAQEGARDSMLDEVYQNLLYGEYALRYTASYGEDGKAGLQYETEYLIAGNMDDSSNLAAAASRLLLLRGAANLAYLLQDENSRIQLQPVAAGISAVLGGWIPEALVRVLLMVVWALAEAVCDVRALLNGGKVPFWKDRDSWQLSLNSIWSLLGGEFVDGADREKGMTYADYLRLLLFVVPLEEKSYRTMDVAEENLALARPDFRMEQAIVQASVIVTGEAAGRSSRLRLTYGY